jgi:hypothetical protein
MLRHDEKVIRVSDVRAVLNDDGTFYEFEIDVTVKGGINKTLRMPQYVAAFLVGGLRGEFEEITERHTKDEGHAMFYASAGKPVPEFAGK